MEDMKLYNGVKKMQFNFVFLYIHIHVITFKLNVFLVISYYIIFKIKNVNFVFVCKFLGINRNFSMKKINSIYRYNIIHIFKLII